MKIRFLMGLLLAFIFVLDANAQIEIRQTQSGEPCYKRGEAKTKGRFLDYDCGKIPGAIDCNEKLEYVEQNNTFFTKMGGPFSGICETCFSNGLLERRIYFTNGKENGTDTTYYKTGCPMVVRHHIMGVEDGTWKFYYDSTQQLAWIRSFSNGKKEGVHVFFDNKGDTTIFENYHLDVLKGIKKEYFTKNRIAKVINYKNGIFNGPFMSFNLAGKKLEDLNYKNGKKNGIFTYYYDDGTLLRTENWIDGIKNGEFKSFYYEGNLMSLENYKKGTKEGLFEEYYSNKKLKNRSIFSKGVLLEEHRFDENGRETYTFGAQPYQVNEDDELPVIPSYNSKKRERKKKSK